MPPVLKTALTDQVDTQPENSPGRIGERNAVAFVGAAPTSLQGRTRKAVLYIGGGRRPRAGGIVDWSRITRGIDGADISCDLVVKGLDGERMPGAVPDSSDEHFAQLLLRLNPETAVRVALPGGDGGQDVLFDGYPMDRSVRWSERGQSLTVTCISRGQEKLRTGEGQQILGRYMRGQAEVAGSEPTWDEAEPDHELITALPAVFNPGGQPNRTARTVAMKVGADANQNPVTRDIYLWHSDNHPNAGYWTYAQALRTLLVMWVVNGGRPISAFQFMKDTEEFALLYPASSADPFRHRITQLATDVSIQSMNVWDALAVLCDAAGLHFDLAIKSRTAGSRPPILNVEHYLRVWAQIETADQLAEAMERNEKRMGVPARHDMPRDRPFADYAGVDAGDIAKLNAAQQAGFTIDANDISLATHLGGHSEVEVSLLLRPGWAPHERLDDLADEDARKAAKEYWEDEFSSYYVDTGSRIPRSIYHAQHPDHAPVADVFRRWIFPDDVEYDATALGRQTGTWTEDKYNVRREDGRLWFEDWTFGGGLLPTRVREWIPRRRPPFDTIGRKSTGTTDRSPIVRFHFGVRDEDGNATTAVPEPDDGGWVEYTGAVEISEERMALRLTESDFWNAVAFQGKPGEAYADQADLAVQAYIDRHFWVQLTCTIRGDQRLIQSIDAPAAIGTPAATGTRRRCGVFDMGTERFVKRLRRGGGAGNSFLSALPADDAEYEDRDDDQSFIAAGFGESAAMAGGVVAGDFEAFFLDRRIQPGDGITGCAGLGFTFEKAPMVRSVIYTNNDGDQRAQIMMSDARHNPEVEA